MAERLTVSLDEFAELALVTPETMRGYVRDLDPQPEWMIERGDRGRAYKIDAEAALAWWQEKREADELASQARKDQLAQLRLDIVGDAGGEDQVLSLSGRQRKEEYEAALVAIKYRKTIGELVEKAAVARVLSSAAVDLRRKLQRIPAEFGIAAGLEAEQVRKLEQLVENSVGAFVDEISAEGAFNE